MIVLPSIYQRIGATDQNIMIIRHPMTKEFTSVYVIMVLVLSLNTKFQANRFNLPGVDDLLSKHISHLFIRDPLVIFSETIDQDDTASSDHFEVTVINLFFLSLSYLPLLEHSIYELADPPLQTSSSRFINRLES